jgi:hypothetical protein
MRVTPENDITLRQRQKTYSVPILNKERYTFSIHQFHQMVGKIAHRRLLGKQKTSADITQSKGTDGY